MHVNVKDAQPLFTTSWMLVGSGSHQGLEGGCRWKTISAQLATSSPTTPLQPGFPVPPTLRAADGVSGFQAFSYAPGKYRARAQPNRHLISTFARPL